MQFGLFKLGQSNGTAMSGARGGARDNNGEENSSFSAELEQADSKEGESRKPAQAKTSKEGSGSSSKQQKTKQEPAQPQGAVLLPEKWNSVPAALPDITAPAAETPQPETADREDSEPEQKAAPEQPDAAEPRARAAEPSRQQESKAAPAQQQVAAQAEASLVQNIQQSSESIQTTTHAQPIQTSATAVSAAENRSPETPQALPTPAAILSQAAEVATEAKKNPGGAITLRLTDADGRPLVLQVSPRVGKVHMIVKTEDRTLSDRLREGLSEVTRGLAEEGVESKVAVFCRKSAEAGTNSTADGAQDDERAKQHAEILRRMRQRETAKSDFSMTSTAV